MKFKFMTWRERAQQSFDKDNIMLTKAGKTFNLYDAIQEAREDTEIYATLEKYGCIDRMMLDKEAVYADFGELKTLRDLKDQQIKAQEMFYNLPLETRSKFNNDMNLFVKEGEKYVKGLIDEELAAKKAQETVKIETPIETPIVKGELANG